MIEKVEIGKEYIHYKDDTKKYKVLGFAKLQISDKNYDLIDMVVYEPLYENQLSKTWVRPLTEFKEKFSEAK